MKKYLLFLLGFHFFLGSAAQKIYLIKFESSTIQINGETTLNGKTDFLPIDEFNFDVSNLIQTSGQSFNFVDRYAGSFQFTKSVSKNSNKFSSALHLNKHFNKITVEVLSSSGNNTLETLAVYTFGLALISSIKRSSDVSDEFQETIGFRSAGVHVKFYKQNPTNASFEEAGSYGWDFLNNVAWDGESTIN